MFYCKSPKIHSLLCAARIDHYGPYHLASLLVPLVWVWKRGNTIKRLDDESKERNGVSIFSPIFSLFQATVLKMSCPIHHENSDYPPSLLELLSIQ